MRFKRVRFKRVLVTAMVLLPLGLGFGLGLRPGTARAEGMAKATLADTKGNTVGEVSLRDTPHGTLLHVTLTRMPPGTHAFHIHAVGKCEPPFTSAGGHFNPNGRKHGIEVVAGPHPGDMPNLHVPESGKLEIEILNTRVRLDARLFDADGAAIVIHQGPDDYKSDPAGSAGPRIACGVVTKT
jgi:Cu-Zn family superoxide dismutase